MILKNKKLLLFTSLATLLPIPVGLMLMKRFPETMAIHFGFSGQADGFASSNYAVFVPPVIMLAVQWLCVLASHLDKTNRERNKKIQQLLLWIIPALSILSSTGIYALALGVDFSPVAWTMIFMGLTFAVLGNYMPKTRMNSTIGIKIPSAYSSEENWNATHRLAGKVWVVGGILIALCWWLPHIWAITVMFTLLTFMILIPIVHSHRFYKKEKAQGKELNASRKRMGKKEKIISGILLAVLLIFLVVILFCGDIRYDFREEYLLVDSSMYTDYVLRYDAIDAMEYREGDVAGLRVGGYGSFRLLMGFFENEEFGTHTRYTYYKPESCIVITAAGKTVVISAENAAETEELYRRLQTAVSGTES